MAFSKTFYFINDGLADKAVKIINKISKTKKVEEARVYQLMASQGNSILQFQKIIDFLKTYFLG